MVKLVNRAKMTTSTTSTGTITLGSAATGYQSFAAAGVVNGDIVRYVIEDGNNWEIGTGTYTASGTTLTRNVSESSNSDSAINLSGSAIVFVSATLGDLQNQVDPTAIDLLIVAGGGSGAGATSSSVGAGGGAGGLIYKVNYPIIPGQTYDIVVGAGGAQTATGAVDGSQGSNSTAFDMTAVGGGYGGHWGNAGGDGGSGGGSAGREFYTTNNFPGNGTPNQGHIGGNSTRGAGTTEDSGGGGGGAGAPGESAKDFFGGDGGVGFACDIEGLSVTTYYAGGGGGGTEAGTSGASGGRGGGGDGGYDGAARRAGTVNTGGGGGGASGSSTTSGAAGGSGVVIVRTLRTASATTGSPTVTTVGNFNIYKFTGSGSITF